MTLGTDQKRHMLKRFRKCYQHEFPRDVTVFIGDAMYDIHFKDKSVTTVQEYIDKIVLRRAKDILEDPAKRVSNYYMLLDRCDECFFFRRVFLNRDQRRDHCQEALCARQAQPRSGAYPRAQARDVCFADRGIVARRAAMGGVDYQPRDHPTGGVPALLPGCD